MIYRYLIRPILFRLDPETSHWIGLKYIQHRTPIVWAVLVVVVGLCFTPLWMG